MNKSRFALDIYMNRMFKIMMYFMPLLALGAGINFTILYLLGKYPDVNLTALIIFDCTNVIYCGLGVLFASICEDKNKNLKPNIVFFGKLVVSLIVIIQWNYISYMIPSRDFWAFFVLFIFVSVFFLDSKYVLHTIAIVLISMFISWGINGKNLLPAPGDLFVPELILRIILINFVSILMFLITFIIERLLIKELENIAEYDSLTLLRNRRGLPSILDDAINSYNNENKKFCFLMADIDDFKYVNDTHGHPFGDIVLRNIGKTFILKAGELNHLFRYGGEEICCVLYMDIEKAYDLAEAIRKEIESSIHTSGNIKVSVTMSMGLTEYRAGLTKDDIIKISDSNLYYAKNHGKNKVVK